MDAKARSQARDQAVKILSQIVSQDANPAQCMETLPPQDRPWIREQVWGALRTRGRAQWVLQQLALHHKPRGKIARAFEIAYFQILEQSLDLRSRLVSEWVSWAKEFGGGDDPGKFFNAILRKVSDQAEGFKRLAVKADQDLETQSAMACVNPWLWQQLVAGHGLDWARDFCEASSGRAPIDLKVKTADLFPEWADSSLAGLPHTRRLPADSEVELDSVFSRPDVMVQDASSQWILAQVKDEIKKLGKPLSGMQALDLCAAPGGKSIGLLWEGAQVTSTDESKDRFLKLQENHRRIGDPQWNLISWDQAQKLQPKTFDLVWVDAPCTSSGLIRRHPDVRWRKSEQDLKSLIPVQEKLIQRGAELVRPGGFLVYSVCSILRDEGEKQIRKSALPLLKSWLLSPAALPWGDGFFGALIQIR